MPACDIGAPYFARFAAVSGIGPLVTVVCSTVAPAAVVTLEFVAAVSALGAMGAAAGAGAICDWGVIALDAGMAPDVSWARAAPASETARKPAVAAKRNVFTVRVP